MFREGWIRLGIYVLIISGLFPGQLAFTASVFAASLHVSPNGSGYTCSTSHPCSLLAALDTASSGDEIFLASGFYGDLIINGRRNSSNIVIAAGIGQSPGFRRVVVRNSSRWVIRGLTISPELSAPYIADYLINIYSDSDNIIVEDNDLFFTQDSSNWSAADWTSIPARYAIFAAGPNAIIRNNRLSNVYFGLVLGGDNSLIEHNTIDHIAGDGMVGSANNLTIRYNVIKNFYKVDDNHDDAIQFHRGNNPTPPIENATIVGNLIISNEPHLTNSLLGSPQGICGFDGGNTGFFRNFRVENNVVLVQHWHGISIYGGSGARIINNIAFDPTGQFPVWISFDNRGSDGVVRNNMASAYIVGGTNVTSDHNLDIEDFGANSLFVDYPNLNVQHRQGSPAIDAGSSLLAPQTDINGNPRPQGAAYDIGAYEHGNADPVFYGDVSENGTISAFDASLVAQFAVGVISLTPSQITKADVTVNGTVSANDAAWIARKVVDPTIIFPVEQ